MEVKVFRKISEIPEEDWRGFFPKGTENYSFLKMLDSLDFPQFRFYYAIVHAETTPIAAAPLFLMEDFQLDMGVKGALRRFTCSLKKVFPRLVSARIIFCGLISGPGQIGIRENPAGVIDALVGAMEELAEKEKAAALVFKDFDVSYEPLLQRLSRQGFVRTKSLPMAVLKINFGSFDEYLKTLSSSSREGFRRKLKKIRENPDFDFEITDTISDEVSGQMHGLYMETVGGSEVEFEELPKNYFSVLSRSMPADEVKYFLWRLNGKLVTFAQCFVRDSHFIDYYLGFDYSVSREYNLFLVRFKRLLEWCLENKMKSYEIGQSSYEIKRRLGFEFLPLYVYSRTRSKTGALFSKIYHKYLAFEHFEPVLKESSKCIISP